jgi:opacity protein-like surface antigen
MFRHTLMLARPIIFLPWLALVSATPNTYGQELDPGISSAAPGELENLLNEDDFFVTGFPLGEFGAHVVTAPGIGASSVVHFDQRGTLGMRLDGYFLLYGIEARWMSPEAVASLVDIPEPENHHDVTMMHGMYSLLAGPQFAFRSGDVRAHVHGGAGLTRFVTTSSTRVSDPWSEPGEETESSTNFDHVTLAWTGGAGLDIRIFKKASLALNIQYLANGYARYLEEGSIEVLPDGSLSINPVESSANLVVFQIGVSLKAGHH